MYERISEVEFDCKKMVIELRKITVWFDEVMEVINEMKERDEKVRIREEETKKFVENLRVEIIEMTKTQLENERKIAEL